MRSVSKMKSRLESVRLIARIKDVRRKLYSTDRQKGDITTGLREKLEGNDFKWLEEVVNDSGRKEHSKVKERQIRKYQSLLDDKRKIEVKRRDLLMEQERMKKEKIKKEVVDLTKNGIDNDIKQYLSLGPDFCETPRRVPYETIITETEKICLMIREEGERKETGDDIIEREVDELREDVRVILERARHKKYPSNLNKQEERGKRRAMKDQNTVYLPADKGRVMVAMDKWESHGGEDSYEFKMKQVLVDLKAKHSENSWRV